MTLATFVLLTFSLSMEVEESDKLNKVSQLTEIAKKKFINSCGMPPNALEVDLNNEIDVRKYFQFSTNEHEFYTLIYLKNDPIAYRQAANHKEVIEKIKNTPYFPYKFYEIADSNYIYYTFRLNKSPARNLVEVLKTRPLAATIEALLQMIKIVKELEQFGVVFTKLNSDSFFITADEVIIFNPIDFATAYQRDGKCYLQTQHLLIRENPKKAIKAIKADNVGLTFGHSQADASWNAFSFVSAIVDYSVYNLKNHYSDEEREIWFNIYYTFADLQENTTLTTEINFGWDELERIIKQSPKKETASSKAEASSSPTRSRRPRHTTTDQSPPLSPRRSHKNKSRERTRSPPRSTSPTPKDMKAHKVAKSRSRSRSPNTKGKDTIKKPNK